MGSIAHISEAARIEALLARFEEEHEGRCEVQDCVHLHSRSVPGVAAAGTRGGPPAALAA